MHLEKYRSNTVPPHERCVFLPSQVARDLNYQRLLDGMHQSWLVGAVPSEVAAALQSGRAHEGPLLGRGVPSVLQVERSS